MNKTPHRHAELIKAWADGETIQVRIGKEWADTNNPGWGGSEYRIKPNTIRFRTYLYVRGDVAIVQTYNETDLYQPENSSNFAKWVGNWQEVEV